MPNAGVTVMGGVNDGMGGLKESLSKFRGHHKEVGEALLNISGVATATGESVDKDEPRPQYNPADNPWPKMVYHPDKMCAETPWGELLVWSQPQLDAALKSGYRKNQFVKPIVAIPDAAVREKALQDTNLQLQGQISQQSEKIAKLETMLLEFMNAKK